MPDTTDANSTDKTPDNPEIPQTPHDTTVGGLSASPFIELPSNMRSFPTAKPKRAALIVVPDSFDLGEWARACGWAEEERAEAEKMMAASGPEGWERTEITYPQLQGIRDIDFVYMGWRGKVRFRQYATGVMAVSPQHVMGVQQYQPEWGRQFKIGKLYHWLYPGIELVEQWPLPDVHAVPGWNLWLPIAGLLSPLGPLSEEPRWNAPKPGSREVSVFRLPERL